MHYTRKKLARVSITFLLLSLFSFNTIAIAQNAEVQMRTISFMEKVMKVSVKDIELTKKLPPFPPIGFPYATVEVDRNIFLVSTEKDIVYKFTANPMNDEKGIQEKSKDEAISEEEAFKSVTRLLSYLKIDAKRSDFKSLMSDLDGMEENNLVGVYWVFTLDFDLNDIPCRTCQLRCSVSAGTGKLSFFQYNPVTPPVNTKKKNVDNATIRANALAWLKKHSYFQNFFPRLVGPEKGEGRLVIAPQWNMFEMDVEKRMQKKEMPLFYCQEEPFVWKEYGNTFEGVVWVDVSTGKAIGAVETDK